MVSSNQPVAHQEIEGEDMGEGFHQSDDEFALDIWSPAIDAAPHGTSGNVNSVEPETANFLRGYMIGKFYSLD